MGDNVSMSTVFEMIVDGQIPGRFVWADDTCVAILTIEPVAPGHVLVIPRQPVDKWTDLEPGVLDHVMRVAQIIGKAQEVTFSVPRTVVIIAGFEVPHTHVHVIPATSEGAASLKGARAADAVDLDEVAHALREVLRNEGHTKHLPMVMSSPRTF
jgi:histidine triad (HIT) family protein